MRYGTSMHYFWNIEKWSILTQKRSCQGSGSAGEHKYLKVDSIVKAAMRYGRDLCLIPIILKEECEHHKNLFYLAARDNSVQNGVSFVFTCFARQYWVDEDFIDEMKKIIDTYEKEEV